MQHEHGNFMVRCYRNKATIPQALALALALALASALALMLNPLLAIWRNFKLVSGANPTINTWIRVPISTQSSYPLGRDERLHLPATVEKLD
jgi:hypothetical protein